MELLLNANDLALRSFALLAIQIDRGPARQPEGMAKRRRSNGLR